MFGVVAKRLHTQIGIGDLGPVAVRVVHEAPGAAAGSSIVSSLPSPPQVKVVSRPTGSSIRMRRS